MKSGRLAVNVLINLNNINIEPKATFNFMGKKIFPAEAETKESQELLNDYLRWLPEHFVSHNCDLTKLEKLEITIWSDFSNPITPLGMSDCKEIMIYASTIWKADGRDEQIINISQIEVVKGSFLKYGIPEIKSKSEKK